jgi:predicted unusual protein kinase regulating ubiquinone biosynthesis (AarF/ABC1/UbiB family)
VVRLRSYWRFLVVARQFFPLIIAYARDRRRFLLFGRSRTVSPATRRRRARKLLSSLLTLGPTFIKLGQLLSTRPDILPPEYVAEFSQLQDSVPPADWTDAREVLEAELGPVDERFEAFDTDAISGASLGQVYRAEVDGDPVAVKVRRPGVETLVEADLRVVRWSLPILIRFVDEAQSFSLETLADEFAKTIRQEMDYRREGRMLQEIRANFADNDAIRMPAVVDSRSTDRVLTMEYIAGTKINDIESIDGMGLDRSQLAERLQRTYLQMVITDGVFHADPHPGNLAVAEDGTLVFYDFGMSGYVDPFVQDRIVEFYGAVARQDIDAILDSLVEMGTLSPEADREVMGDVMELAIADARGQDIEQYRVQQIVQQVEDTMYEFPLRLPSNLALVLRVATVVEGVCVTLDPEFDFISVATSYLGEEGYIEEGAREYVREQGREVRDAATASLRIPPKLESALDRVERENLTVRAEIADPDDRFETLARRVVLGLVFAAGIVSTTLLGVLSSPPAAGVAGGLTLLVGALLYRSFRTERGISAQPKFTRQRMRQREAEAEGEADGALGFGDLAAVGPDATAGDDGAASGDDPGPAGAEAGTTGSDRAATGSAGNGRMDIDVTEGGGSANNGDDRSGDGPGAQ